ncbi:hypothetical protein Gasu2_49730 [Galdieria sulphuraria]|nr:hypothetical protein Gasu2_49730 [Galdieria sulphuraria]
MEEDIFEKDLKLENGNGEDMLNEAIEVLNANFSTEDASPETLCDFDFGHSRVEQFFTGQDRGKRTSDLVVGNKNLDDFQDTSWETVLPCTTSSFHRHSPETTFCQDVDHQRNRPLMPVGLDTRRDGNNLNTKLYSTKYCENQGSVSSSWEFGNYLSSHNWSRSFQSSSTFLPITHCNQPTFFTSYSGPRESERVTMAPDGRSSYIPISSRYAGREHFHVPCLSSSLSGTKISNAGESLSKRNKTPTAFCSSCMQNVSANGGNFQRHQEACRRRHGKFNEPQNARMIRQDFPNDVKEDMTVSKTNESFLLPHMDEDSGVREKDKKPSVNKEKSDKNEENSMAIQRIFENFREADVRDTQILAVLQELRKTLTRNLDGRLFI